MKKTAKPKKTTLNPSKVKPMRPKKTTLRAGGTPTMITYALRSHQIKSVLDITSRG